MKFRYIVDAPRYMKWPSEKRVSFQHWLLREFEVDLTGDTHIAAIFFDVEITENGFMFEINDIHRIVF